MVDVAHAVCTAVAEPDPDWTVRSNSIVSSQNSMGIMRSRSNELCEESMQCRTSFGFTEVVLGSC